MTPVALQRKASVYHILLGICWQRPFGGVMKSKGPTRATPGSLKLMVSIHAINWVGSGWCGGRWRMEGPYSIMPLTVAVE